MTPRKKDTEAEKAGPPPKAESGQNKCFVISPIGGSGTEQHARFKDVLEYVIKAAVKASGYHLEVLRADDIDRAGSFIRDILEQLYTSYLVIADLTEQNPNVFYELGVRHALSPRTLLIAPGMPRSITIVDGRADLGSSPYAPGAGDLRPGRSL